MCDDGCKRASLLTSMAKEGPEMAKLQKDNAELLASISRLMGTPVVAADIVPPIESLAIQLENNLDVDTWIPDLWPKANLVLNEWFSIILGYGLAPQNGIDLATELPRARGGPMLWDIIGRLQEKIRCHDAEDCRETKQKYYMYSSV
ncbi:Lysosomal acid phosphatase [Aphelenchoides avenae]|nr:Lysosomal acid phosphatase [Aphelenchus avenae]